MGLAHRKDATSEVKAVYGALSSATAAGSGDNSAVSGDVLDRLGYDSLKVVLTYKATLGGSETLTLKDIDIREGDSSDASDGTWAELIADAAVLSTTGDGTSEIDIDLSAYGRYVQVRYTPDLSASGTDTAQVGLTYILGGKRDGLPS